MSRARAQLGMDLLGGSSPLDLHQADPADLQPSLAHDDPMPAGPYAVGLTKTLTGEHRYYEGPPYIIVAANRQCVAGFVNCKAAAEAIVEALNREIAR